MGNCNSQKNPIRDKINTIIDKRSSNQYPQNIQGEYVGSSNNSNNRKLDNYNIYSNNNNSINYKPPQNKIDMIYTLKSYIENIHYTSDSLGVYLLPVSWFNQLIKFINSNGQEDLDYSICNKENINKNNVISVIHEIMKELLNHFNIDYILRLDVSEANIEFNSFSQFHWKYVDLVSLNQFRAYGVNTIKNQERYEDVEDNVDKTYTNLAMICNFNYDKYADLLRIDSEKEVSLYIINYLSIIV